MNGPECLAGMLVSGQAFGISPGASISDVTAALGADFAEQRHGRAGQRLLRRDYGLVEVTFDHEPDWVCGWLSVEVHRLASHDGLAAEVLQKHGVTFSKYASWHEVKSILDAVPDCHYEEFERHGGYRSWRVSETRAVIRVVDRNDLGRTGHPGHGDVWDIEISR